MKVKIAKKILKMEKDKLMSKPEPDRDWELITALEIALNALHVKTAYWIRQETPYGYANSYECSECGRVIWNDEGEEGLEDFPYCHCGCRMIDKKGDRE